MSKTKAVLNWSNMSTDAFTMLDTCQKAVNALSLAENELTEVVKNLGDVSKEYKREMTEAERQQVKDCKEKATNLCTAFLMRNVSTEDYLHGEIYHIDMVAFLQNIGVLTDGEETEKTARKVKAVTAEVIDRYKETVTRRKKGNDKLTHGEKKSIKNTPIEMVLAIIECAVNSKCFEYSQGGIAYVKFDK